MITQNVWRVLTQYACLAATIVEPPAHCHAHDMHATSLFVSGCLGVIASYAGAQGVTVADVGSRGGPARRSDLSASTDALLSPTHASCFVCVFHVSEHTASNTVTT